MQNILCLQRIETQTSAHEVGCYVCGRGLDDGSSVTAKALRGGTVLFCDDHYKM